MEQLDGCDGMDVFTGAKWKHNPGFLSNELAILLQFLEKPGVHAVSSDVIEVNW